MGGGWHACPDSTDSYTFFPLLWMFHFAYVPFGLSAVDLLSLCLLLACACCLSALDPAAASEVVVFFGFFGLELWPP
jgi:hypothetical protein